VQYGEREVYLVLRDGKEEGTSASYINYVQFVF